MSHKSLYQQGKITRQEYENAQYLKDSGQKNFYKLYEKGLDERAKRRERNAKLIEKGKPVPYVQEAEQM
jgi:hypothetical protein